MKDHLKKALNLVKNTGDKIIVFDDINSDSAYVVMNMSEYEDIVLKRKELSSLTEEELLDKINRDIAIWKSQQDLDDLSKFEDEDDDDMSSLRSAGIKKEEDTSFMTEPKEEKKRWAIPKDVKEGAEEIIEEDRQYLEEITF